MQIKTPSIIVLSIIAVITSFTYLACKKSSNCTSMLYTGAPHFAYLQINDSQNRNLLDPATLGHYDTAFVKRSNTWFKLTAPGITPVLVVFDFAGHEGANVLNLSTTDQDALGISTETVNQTCSFYTKLSALNYNGTVLNTTAQSNVYIAHQ